MQKYHHEMPGPAAGLGYVYLGRIMTGPARPSSYSARTLRAQRKHLVSLVIACLLAGLLGFFLHAMLMPASRDFAPSEIHPTTTAPSPASAPPTTARAAPPPAPMKPPALEEPAPSQPTLPRIPDDASAPEDPDPEPLEGGVIRGWVLDAYGVGIADARIQAQVDSGSDGFQLFLSDQAGQFPDLTPDQLREQVFRRFRRGGGRRGRGRRGRDRDNDEEANKADTALYDQVIGKRRFESSTRSAEDGSFELSGLLAGTWHLNAGATRYLEARETTEVSETVPGDIELILEIGAELIGLVRDTATGVGIDDAEVVAVHRETGESLRAATDPSGSFEMAGLRDGDWRFNARARGFVPLRLEESKAVRLTVSQGPGIVELHLRPAASFSGRVVDETGEPVPGAYLFATTANDVVSRATTDKVGAYTVDQLETGTYDVLVRSKDYALTTRLQVQVHEGGDTPGVDIMIARAAQIEGLVLSPDGSPAGGIRLSCSQEGTGHAERQARTSEDGRFLIEHLYAGRYHVRINRRGTGGGLAPSAASVDVGPGERARLDIQLQAGAELSGQVIDASGIPVAGIDIHTFLGSDNVNSDRTNEEGAFRLRGLIGGTYSLFARSRRGGVMGHLDLVVQPGGSYEGIIVRVAAGASLNGQVLGPNGQPLAGLQIQARDANDRPVFRRGTTDDQGRFVISNLYDGNYIVAPRRRDLERAGVAWPEDIEPPAVEVSIRAGRAASDIVLRVTPGR